MKTAGVCYKSLSLAQWLGCEVTGEVRIAAQGKAQRVWANRCALRGPAAVQGGWGRGAPSPSVLPAICKSRDVQDAWGVLGIFCWKCSSRLSFLFYPKQLPKLLVLL